MPNDLTPVGDLIPEANIVVFSPHFDDFLFMLGGYVLELNKQSLGATKKFHIVTIFSRSNYQAGTGEKNFDYSIDRIKYATGRRLLEDTGCMNALLGRFNYRYELLGEDECLLRGKGFADSEMEFPHGMYDDFNEEDWQIFERMKQRILSCCALKDTALVFPMAFKEHVDHFIVREAAAAVLKDLNGTATAKFYFQEDKPYAGIATEAELNRISAFIETNRLLTKTYTCDPEKVIELAFKYYISQVEEVYKTGIRERANFLQKQMHALTPCDRIYVCRT